MKTYKLNYYKKDTDQQQLEAQPSEENPELIALTDFDKIGIIPVKVGNAGMIEAIEAVAMITNCVVIAIERH